MAFRPWILAAVAVVVAAGCNSTHHDTPCPRNQPAFRIQLTASDGVLPPDTRIVVRYSGIERESYSLASGGVGNQDVCCRPATPVSGVLPDVRCGLPLSTTGASGGGDAEVAIRDASLLHDAGRALPDAAMTTSMDASARRDASVLDASTDAGPDASDASAAPAGYTAIVCDLWTNGVANVAVTGTGYAKLVQILDDTDIPDPRCGVRTVDHRLTLTHMEGGLLE